MRIFVFLLMTALPGFSADLYEFSPDTDPIEFVTFTEDSTFKGNFPNFSGDLRLDFDDLERSTIDVTIDTQNARTGVIFATQALKGPKLLFAEQYPNVRFVSRSITRDGYSALVQGDLTIRDVTKSVTLEVELFREAGSDPDDLDNLIFIASTSINRNDFGADGFPNIVKPQLDIKFRAKIRRVQ
ncbi:MAG: YceI family protein [Pseudomonadota bacterium]